MAVTLRRERTFEYFLAGLFFLWVIISWGWQNVLPHFRLVNLIVAVFLSATLIFKKRWRSLHLTKIGIVLIVFAIWQLISLSWTPLPAYAIDDVSQFVLLVILYFVLSSYFSSDDRINVWENVLIAGILIVVLLALRESWDWYFSWWQEWRSLPPFMERLSSKIVGHPNVLAGLINLVIPIILVRWLRSQKRNARVWSSAFLLIFLLALYLTSSRGGWVSGIVGIGITLLIVFKKEIRSLFQNSTLRNLFSARHLAYLVLILISLVLVFLLLYFNYRSNPVHGGRLGIWIHAWEVWRGNLLLGNGAGSFGLMYSRQVQNPPGFWAVHAHNGLLQISAEFGIIGLILQAGLVFLVVQKWWRAYRSSDDENKRYRLAGYAGIFGAVLAHQLIDFAFYSPVYSLVVLLVVIWLEAPDGEQYVVANAKIHALVFGFLFVIFVAGSWISLQGLSGYWRGIMSSWNDDWQSAHQEFCELAERYPRKSFYGFQCGLAGLYVYDQTGNQDMLAVSLKAHQAALDIDPVNDN